eukprot:5767_1
MVVYSERDQWRIAVVTIAIFVLVIILTMVHSAKFYSDFFTQARDVLNFRRAKIKPEITPRYKLISYLTYATLILCLILLLVEVIQFNFSVGGCTSRNLILSIIDKFAWLSSRCLTYLIFILWLHELYGKTPKYAHNPTKLGVAGIIVIIFYLTIFILITVCITRNPVYFSDFNKSQYPYFCQVLWDEDLISLIMGTVAIFEIIACITAIVCFIRPLNRLATDCNQKQNDDNTRLQKLMYLGYKYKTLVITNTTYTLIWMALAICSYTAMATGVGQLDFFINPLCLVLMTYYYPNDRYYERFCCLCIACCDPKRQKYKSKATIHKRDEDSIDTDMAFYAKLLELEQPPNNRSDNERIGLINN